MIFPMKLFSTLYIDSHTAYFQSFSFTTDELKLKSMSDACSSTLSVGSTAPPYFSVPFIRWVFHILSLHLVIIMPLVQICPLCYLFICDIYIYIFHWLSVKLPVAQVIGALILFLLTGGAINFSRATKATFYQCHKRSWYWEAMVGIIFVCQSA